MLDAGDFVEIPSGDDAITLTVNELRELVAEILLQGPPRLPPRYEPPRGGPEWFDDLGAWLALITIIAIVSTLVCFMFMKDGE